jgi:hypothetical protein
MNIKLTKKCRELTIEIQKLEDARELGKHNFIFILFEIFLFAWTACNASNIGRETPKDNLNNQEIENDESGK